MKHSSFSFLLLLITLTFVLGGCTTMRQLSVHKNTLDRLAYGDMPPQEKFDGLANTLVSVIDESLRIVNPTKTYNYLDKFSNQNRASLNKLYEDLDAWRAGMNKAQKVAFGARTLTKPYTRRLANIGPKLKKRIGSRYTQLALLVKISNLLKIKQKN